MRFEAGQLVAIGGGVVGRVLLLDAKLLELLGLALDGLGEVAGLKLEVLGAEDALGDLRGEALDGALLLLAGERLGPGLAFGGGEPGTGAGDFVDRLFDARGSGFEIGGDTVELGGPFLEPGVELLEEGARVPCGLLVRVPKSRVGQSSHTPTDTEETVV